VNDFDHRAQSDCPLPLVIKQFGGQQQQGWPDSFAPAGAQIFANLGDGLNARDRAATKLIFERDEVFPQQVEYLFPANGGRCAQ
jgi:hypothetical protein